MHVLCGDFFLSVGEMQVVAIKNPTYCAAAKRSSPKTIKYSALKRNLRRDTMNASMAISALTMLTGDTGEVCSVLLGATFSNLYLSNLITYVDNVGGREGTQVPKQVLLPIVMMLFQSQINKHTNIDMNFLTTIASFMTYKFSIMRVMVEECLALK